MDREFAFRPGTSDEQIFRGISEGDEYRLPESFGEDDIVVDIGVHVGGFCYAALEKGAPRVYGFEAEPSNFTCACTNLRRFGDRVRLTNRAVWRSDVPVETLPFTFSDNPANTGGGGCIWSTGTGQVPAIAFDDAMREITEGGRRRVRMLKIDCEGSEFPILLTSKMLYLIDYIAGEFHELGGDYDRQTTHEHFRVKGYDRYTIAELTGALTRAGFLVTAVRSGASNMGVFYARRPGRIAERMRWMRRRMSA